MLTVRAIYDQGKIEWLEPLPDRARGIVAVVFLESDSAESDEAQEALLMAQSPAFRQLVEQGLSYITTGQTHPIQVLLDELPD